ATRCPEGKTSLPPASRTTRAATARPLRPCAGTGAEQKTRRRPAKRRSSAHTRRWPTAWRVTAVLRPPRSPGGRGGAGADAVDALGQQVAVLRQRGRGVVHLGRIIRRAAIAFLERQAPVAGRLALGLGLGEWQVRAVEVAQLAGAARVGAAYRPAHRGRGRH